MHLMGKNYICNNANKKCKALRGSIFQVLLARSSILQIYMCRPMALPGPFELQLTVVLIKVENLN